MNTQSLKANETLIIRLAVGLIFGLGIAWLIKSFDALEGKQIPLWAQVLTSTLILGAFIIWAGAGAMKRLSLAIWSVIALGLIALIAWNRAAHSLDANFNPFFLNLSFLIYPFLFISHELVSSADQAGKPIAPYALYFDEAWKRGVQLVLSGLFTILFWAILFLGAGLLGFIGFHWFKDLLMNAYFAWPVTGLAIAASVNLGDVQPKLMHNFRALVLGVLSWLLPVITVIGLLFAVSLCFSGLEPLWKTKAATASLLAGCVALVLLVNAAYQQGNEERSVHIVLRWSALIACGLLLVFAGLAAWSLWLRIDQYGLTPERTLALVGVTIAMLYGVGYAVAAVMPKDWLALLAPVNIALAFVVALICLCVLTPIADPYRLSASSQAARVDSGKVTPDKFDWRVLRFETGTYGLEELKRLSMSGNTTVKNAAAKALALKDTDRYSPLEGDILETRTPDPKQFIVSYPKGTTPPADFLTQSFSDNERLPDCASSGIKCYSALIDLNHDGVDEFALLENRHITIYIRENRWRLLAERYVSDETAAAFKIGQIGVARPSFDNLTIGNTYRGEIGDIRAKGSD
ncbi:DUF4153 domain-containing protein [Asticcacaulis taihuensis]|uniref:DUF4153 domain-containing protein n=2 Tax=Asticcacaulis taihuensis TaxID=260084 RepID=A0A1G4S0X5_9CAUL|nr:protein of unknown function [Asticcacaulis taihuensis]